MAGKKTLLGKINNLFPTCKEITLLVVKEHEMELSRNEKIKLIFHSSMCKFCKMFRKQSALLNEHIHKAAEQSETEAPKFKLSNASKAQMQSELNKESR